jgi:hypothetical protein
MSDQLLLTLDEISGLPHVGASASASSSSQSTSVVLSDSAPAVQSLVPSSLVPALAGVVMSTTAPVSSTSSMPVSSASSQPVTGPNADWLQFKQVFLDPLAAFGIQGVHLVRDGTHIYAFSFVDNLYVVSKLYVMQPILLRFKQLCRERGVPLNMEKTELYFPSSQYPYAQSSEFGCKVLHDKIDVLGIPISYDTTVIQQSLSHIEEEVASFLQVSDEVLQLPAAYQFALMRNSQLGKMGYVLRCLPPGITIPAAELFDDAIQNHFCKISGIDPGDLSDQQQRQMKLPIHHLGGCGLRKMVDVAALAWNASLSVSVSQRDLTMAMEKEAFNKLKQDSNDADTIRLHSLCSDTAFKPMLHLGLNNSQFCSMIRLRLNAMESQRRCKFCDLTVPLTFQHMNSCKYKAKAVIRRHDMVVRSIADAMQDVGIHCIVEPRHSYGASRKRPDIAFWHKDDHGVDHEFQLDAQIVNPTCAAFVAENIISAKNGLPLKSLDRAAQMKINKYADYVAAATPGATFIPLIFDVFGTMHQSATSFFQKFGISVANILVQLQRGNDVVYKHFCDLD